MAKAKVTKRSFSSYETQRIILVVLLAALLVTAVIYAYQTRSTQGEVSSPGQSMYEEMSPEEGVE